MPGRNIISSPLLARLQIFGLTQVVVAGSVLTYVATSGLSHPGATSLPLWTWLVLAGLSVGLGALGAIGFTSDLAREIRPCESGVEVVLGSVGPLTWAAKRVSYDWDELSPDAPVWPGQIRFKARPFRPIFLTVQATKELLSHPDAPSWELPPKVRRALGLPPLVS